MKQVIKDHLASLREREELEAIVPDLMSEMGFHVYSRPSRGVPQFGVDVAAVGDDEGERCLFLVTIKRGNLTRVDWDSGNEQDVRRSLNEIRESYLRRQVPRQLRHLRVIIVVCCGGEVKETARGYLTDYTDNYSTPRLTFREWNGDFLADQIERGMLREGLLSGRARSALRETLATTEDPETSFDQFSELVRQMLGRPVADDAERISAVRRVLICLSMLHASGRGAGNLEAPYRATEFVLLQVWHYAREVLSGTGKPARTMGDLLFKLVQLHVNVADEYLAKILPHAGNKNAIASAAGAWTQSELDVNLVLFELLGRLSLRGLWLVWDEGVSGGLPTSSRPLKDRRVHALAARICALVESNSVLASPVMDEQVVDLALAFTFLAAHGGCGANLRTWFHNLAATFERTYVLNRRYPCIHTDYLDLLEHPRRDDPCRERATAASVLLPTLAFWVAAIGDTEALRFVAGFRERQLSHSALQLWLPHDDSEAHLYLNDDQHGSAYTDIPVTADPDALLDYVLAECGPETPFFKLSAVEQGFWPLVLMACRHHRLPIPPHFWPGLLPETGLEPVLDMTNGEAAHVRQHPLRRSQLKATTTWLP